MTWLRGLRLSDPFTGQRPEPGGFGRHFLT